MEQLHYSICGMATNAETALEEIALLEPDIAILDIRVEGIQTGLWLGSQLNIPIIYLTAFNDAETIKNAITTNPVSYLVKPFNTNELFIAVELAVSKIKKEARIIVKDRDKNIFVSVDDILFAKKEDQYLMLYLKDSGKLMRGTITDFLEKVDSTSFLQVHRSYVVNKNHITAFNNKEITIKNEVIPISKNFAKEVLTKIS